jgi:hypothetical protein
MEFHHETVLQARAATRPKAPINPITQIILARCNRPYCHRALIAASLRMGIGNNPSIKSDLFADQTAPDASSPSAIEQMSANMAGPAATSTPSYSLPQYLPSALKYLDDDQLDRLLAAVVNERQRRGKEVPASNEASRKQRVREAPPGLTLGKLNAVRAAFKAGVTPSRIARQFGISHADVRKALASNPSK